MTSWNINVPAALHGAFKVITEPWPVCDPLALLTTVFHRFYDARRALYVIETTFLAEFESHSLRQSSGGGHTSSTPNHDLAIIFRLSL
jgi:hypothetical protein